jgi:hypothetical protein
MAKIDLGQISGVGRLLFVICLLTGVAITAATNAVLLNPGNCKPSRLFHCPTAGGS